MAVERLQGLNRFEALGVMVAICDAQGSYLTWSIEDLSRFFMPPIGLDQYCVFEAEKSFVGFVTWACLSEQLSDALKARHEEPARDQWRSGEQLWFMDMVCAEKHTRDICLFLQKNVFHDTQFREAHAVRRASNGQVRRIARFSVPREM